jgi:hypothetical protein
LAVVVASRRRTADKFGRSGSMAKKEEWTYWQIVSQGMDVEDRRLRMFVRHKASLGVGREHILRKLLADQTPEPYRVNTGFVAHPAGGRVTSDQCDVLVYDPRVSQPLYRIDEFVVVPPDAARIAIEVRSNMSLGDDSGLEQVVKVHRSMRPAFPTEVFGFGFRGPTFGNFVAGVAAQVRGDIFNVPECVAVHKQNYVCIRSTARAALPENTVPPRVCVALDFSNVANAHGFATGYFFHCYHERIKHHAPFAADRIEIHARDMGVPHDSIRTIREDGTVVTGVVM